MTLRILFWLWRVIFYTAFSIRRLDLVFIHRWSRSLWKRYRLRLWIHCLWLLLCRLGWRCRASGLHRSTWVNFWQTCATFSAHFLTRYNLLGLLAFSMLRNHRRLRFVFYNYITRLRVRLAMWTWWWRALDNTCGLLRVLERWCCHFLGLRHLTQTLLAIYGAQLLLSMLGKISFGRAECRAISTSLLWLLLLNRGIRLLWLAQSGNALLKLHFGQRRLAGSRREVLWLIWTNRLLILASLLGRSFLPRTSARRSTTTGRHMLQRLPYLWVGCNQLLVLLIYLI